MSDAPGHTPTTPMALSLAPTMPATWEPWPLPSSYVLPPSPPPPLPFPLPLPELPVVLGDRVRLTEVFQNLIANAVKYMGDQTNPRIEIGSRSDEAEVVCFVRDNGMGIDPRYHEKVFGLFERLDASNEGTGIGLALVKRIIEVHGGRVWVESEGRGQGSTFLFTLPWQA